MAFTQAKADFIRALADETGHISPHVVLAAGRDPASIIHEDFTWDDANAGEKYRLDEAAKLIKLVKLEFVISRTTCIAPHYAIDPVAPPRARSYIELTRVALDPTLARQVIDAELERITAQVKRLRGMAAVVGLTTDLDQSLFEIITNTAAVCREEAEEPPEPPADKPRGKPKGRPRGRPRGGSRPEVRA